MAKMTESRPPSKRRLIALGLWVTLVLFLLTLATGNVRWPVLFPTAPTPTAVRPTPTPNPYSVTEYPLPSGHTRPLDIVAGPDGALWFTEYGASAIGRITVSGKIVEFVLPTSAAGIAAGPDGTLWFTEPEANKIGRITTNGAIREFALPYPDSQPGDITAGPNQTLWFIEHNANRIGRITVDGTFTELALSANHSARRLTYGPDGAFWFTEDKAISRITIDGALATFPVSTSEANLSDITPGPDGACWFTEGEGDLIGRITTTGQITEFPVSSHAIYGPALVEGITAGPDGVLWFTEIDANRIGRMTTQGAEITGIALPSPQSAPQDIVIGPDGAVWFTEYGSGGNKIGRIGIASKA